MKAGFREIGPYDVWVNEDGIVEHIAEGDGAHRRPVYVYERIDPKSWIKVEDLTFEELEEAYRKGTLEFR